ncbi:hypothetical protein ACLMAB_10570 [Brevibacillus laterosporus]
MSKFVETNYSNKKEILKFPDHYVALAVTVDDTGITTNGEGKKIVPAGTILGGEYLLTLPKWQRKLKRRLISQTLMACYLMTQM